MATKLRGPESVASTPTAAFACCRPFLLSDLSEKQATYVATLLKAVADPTRLRILNLLAAQEDSVCVCDLVATFPLGQPTISHHLRVLREAGLVEAEKRGLWVHYRLKRVRAVELQALLGDAMLGQT